MAPTVEALRSAAALESIGDEEVTLARQTLEGQDLPPDPRERLEMLYLCASIFSRASLDEEARRSLEELLAVTGDASDGASTFFATVAEVKLGGLAEAANDLR